MINVVWYSNHLLSLALPSLDVFPSSLPHLHVGHWIFSFFLALHLDS